MKSMKKMGVFLLMLSFVLLFKMDVYALKDNVKEVSTANDFIAELSKTESSKIILTSDFIVEETANITKDVSIDLNGHTLKFNLSNKKTAFNISSGSSLTLDDGQKSGTLSTNAKWIFYTSGGHITIKNGHYIINNDTDGEFSTKYMFSSVNGKIDILGGQFTSTGNITNGSAKTTFYMFYLKGGEINLGNENTKDTDIVVEDNLVASTNYMFSALTKGSVNISAGTYNTRGSLFYFLGKDRNSKIITNITGGKFHSSSTGIPIYLLDYTKTTITGGDITTSGYGIFVSSYDHLIADPAVELIIGDNKGGNPSITSSSFAISGNHLDPGTKITINSGKIISKNAPAIYHPQQGILTINGGLIQGQSGIAAKMGQIVINGGTIVGLGELDSSVSSEVYGGSVADGSALSFSIDIYPAVDGVEEEYGNRLSVTINDGVFISKQGNSMTVYDWNFPGQEQKVTFDIKNGRFTNFPVTKIATIYDSASKTATITSTKNYLNISSNNTTDNKEYNWIPQAYYENGKIDYGYQQIDAPYYATLSEAVLDNKNESYNSKNNIYYLQGKIHKGNILEYTKIIHGWNICQEYIPESVIDLIGEDKLFPRDVLPLKSNFEGYASAEIVKDKEVIGYLYFPIITFDSNEGIFENHQKFQKTIVTAVSKIATENVSYIALDNGKKFDIKTDNLLVLPETPTKEGATFIGWYYDKDSTERPVDFSKTKIQDNIVVYAHYRDNVTGSSDVEDKNNSSSFITNPNTSDNIMFNLTCLFLSCIALCSLGICYRKKYKTK